MIRKATMEDVSELASFDGGLGYPTTDEEMKGRFKNIGTNLLYNTQVAEVNGNIAGMIGMNLGYHYEKNGNYIRIVALVVDQNYRRQGIGERLIQTAEEWAREKGATKLVLNSGNRDERSDAQQFYKDRGFEGKATGFYKDLI